MVERVSPARAAEGGPGRSAGLTVNPVKFVNAREKTEYLGFTFGGGVIKPHAIESCPLPQTQKKLRPFLGMADFYHWIIPIFSARAALLQNKQAPDAFITSSGEQRQRQP